MTDPFAFYGIEQKFNVDADVVKNLYYRIAKENHPDFFMNDAVAYQKALEMTAANNGSFEILKDFEKRTAFILEQTGMMKDSGKLPMDFLSDMMEINESISELSINPDSKRLSEIKKDLERLESVILIDWQKAATNYDANLEPNKNLEKIKDCYLKHKYFLRIKESLTTFATP
jgi:molecular chaperone HscB